MGRAGCVQLLGHDPSSPDNFAHWRNREIQVHGTGVGGSNRGPGMQKATRRPRSTGSIWG